MRDRIQFRFDQLRADTVNPESRTVVATIATESAVPMFDRERWTVIPEVLLVSGVTLPKQVPLLDGHDRSTVNRQLGSIRDLQVSGDHVVGTLHFSTAKEAEKAFTLVREGHLTDISAGYEVLEKTHVPSGKSELVAGRNFTGPVNVVTSWGLKEGSLVPIGADEHAKLRFMAGDLEASWRPSGFQEGGDDELSPEDQRALGELIGAEIMTALDRRENDRREQVETMLATCGFVDHAFANQCYRMLREGRGTDEIAQAIQAEQTYR
ncbi:hypothetical protein [Planctomicrobium sp. SH664]|uniref:hypothetical protein n=1 Tax=Planctomicrobium sp. SH664 TaxID=3448125 RepID=UPI003F5B135A